MSPCSKKLNTIVDAIHGSWMTKNKTFHCQADRDEPVNDADSRIRLTWEKRWDYLNTYFHRFINSTDSLIKNQEANDEIHKVIHRWSTALYNRMCPDADGCKTPIRRYHTPIHLEEMFGYVDILLSHVDDILQLEENLERTQQGQEREREKRRSLNRSKDDIEATMILSIFFHDAIYDPKSSINEEDSAALYRTFASEITCAIATMNSIPATTNFPCLSSFDHGRVEQYILATKQHNVPPCADICLKLFVDVDMAVLGKDEGAYEAYAKLIREEYIHVERNVYCEKRSQVLSSFVDNEKPIFASKVMRDAFEDKARRNIVREIELLSKGIFPGEPLENGVLGGT